MASVVSHHPQTPASGQILCFDASESQLWAGLVTPNGIISVSQTKLWNNGRERAIKMLQLIQSVRHLSKKITSLATIVGPATPGGIRHNVTLANALAWGLNLPVASFKINPDKTIVFTAWKKAGTLRPLYIHKPNITNKPLA